MQKQRITFWVIWLLKAITAFILLQTLFFKFTGHPQSVELFTKLGLFGLDESIGRIGTGIIELLVSIILLIPRTAILGSLGVVGLMTGALYFHITILGFDGANGQLAVMASFALVSGVVVFIFEYIESRSRKIRV